MMKRNAGAGLALVLLLAVYGPALTGGFLWDDDRHVPEPELRSVEGLRRIWTDVGATQQYYPLLYTAFWLEHRLWGNATFGYHLVNVLLHGLAAGLLAGLLRRLEVPGAWLAAALFAFHPIQVESVAWISEQKNTLSAVFYLTAAHLYLRFEADRRRESYVLATSAFIAALLTKSVTATLPAALLVLRWWRTGRLTRSDVGPLVPWLALGGVMGLVTAWVERSLLGAGGAEWGLGALERVLLAGRIFWFYLGKLIWPSPLVFIYPRWTIDAASLAAYVYPLAAVVLVVQLWRWRAAARGPLAALLLYAGTLFPALGFIDVYPFRFSYVADHFQYLAGLAVFAAAGAVLAPRIAAYGGRGLAAAGIVLAGLGILTAGQARLYRDSETLYRATLEANPGCFLCQNNLGNDLVASGRAWEAATLFESALEARPNDADLRFNLGRSLEAAGRVPEAVEAYQRALAAAPSHSRSAYNLANVLARTGRVEEAIPRYEAVLHVEPANADVHNNLAMALGAAGRVEEAIVHYRKAIEVAPGQARTHNNLGVALAAVGRADEARAEYEAALALDPDLVPALRGLAGLHLAQGRKDEAIALHERALRVTPGDPRAHYAFARVLWSVGRPADAAAHVREALRLDPQYADARATLARLEKERGARPAR